MSATIYGINTGGFTPNNDFSASQSDKGGWTATQTFQYVHGSLSDTVFRNTFSKGRRATEIDVNLDAYWARLYLDRVSIATGTGGIDVITVYYAGYAGFESGGATPLETIPVYSLSGSLREVSIAEHPSVAALSLVNRILIQGVVDGVFIWDETNSVLNVAGIDPPQESADQPSGGDATLFVQKASQGKVTYDRPTFTWEKTWESEQPIATATVNNLGKIDSPDGDPPTPNGSRNWRLVDASQEQRGELYRNRLLWELSERGGWDADLYDY